MLGKTKAIPRHYKNVIVRRGTMSFALIVVLFLSGCAFGSSEPKLTLEQMQGTAEANAQKSIELTRAAEPTATQLPSPTPLPPVIIVVTETPAFVFVTPGAGQPTQAFVQPTQPGAQPIFTQPTGTKAPDCSGLIDYDMPGSKVTVSIYNKTKGYVTLSLYLEPNKLGNCGSQSVNISGGETITMSLYTGCYWLYAWVNDPKQATTVKGYSCVKEKDRHQWTITYDLIDDILK